MDEAGNFGSIAYFLRIVIRDPRFPSVVDDLVVEFGGLQYQAVMGGIHPRSRCAYAELRTLSRLAHESRRAKAGDVHRLVSVRSDVIPPVFRRTARLQASVREELAIGDQAELVERLSLARGGFASRRPGGVDVDDVRRRLLHGLRKEQPRSIPRDRQRA
jgi:hypothetical protein